MAERKVPEQPLLRKPTLHVLIAHPFPGSCNDTGWVELENFAYVPTRALLISLCYHAAGPQPREAPGLILFITGPLMPPGRVTTPPHSKAAQMKDITAHSSSQTWAPTSVLHFHKWLEG